MVIRNIMRMHLKCVARRVLLGLIGNLPVGRISPCDMVLFKVDRIGDFILSLGALHALLDRKDQRCTLIVNETVVPLAETEFPWVNIVPVKFETGTFFRELVPALFKVRCANLYACKLVCLRHQRIDFHNALLHAIRCGSSFGFSNTRQPDWRNSLAYGFSNEAHCDYFENQYVCRELQRHHALASLVLAGSPNTLPRQSRLEAERQPSWTEVLIAPLGTNPIRDIPFHILDAVIRLILNHTSASITIFASASQAARLKALSSPGWPRTTFRHDMALLEYVRRVSTAGLIISAESATSHLATLFDRFLLCFCGGGHYGEFAPWSKSGKQVWLTNPLSCFDCNWDCIYDVPVCLQGISMDAVNKSLINQLERCGLKITDV